MHATLRFWGTLAVGLLLTIASTATARYRGSGTADAPYQIATAADLILLGDSPEDYDKHFVLTADIDLDPKLPGRKVFDKAVIAPDTDPATSDFDGTPFTGVFDGNSHTISHLTIAGRFNSGLFGCLKSGAEVKDLGAVAVNITGSQYTGSLVGRNEGNVFRCYGTGAVTGDGEVGGRVGINVGGVTQCYSTGTVIATGPCSGSLAGGLIGQNHGGVIHCHSSSAVSGTRLHIGGLVGYNFGAITQCYSTGAVSGQDGVGGFVGDNAGGVTACYSTGAVTGGGLVGSNYKYGTITQCFWDTQTSGRSSSAGGVGLSVAQMRGIQAYLMAAGWDWIGETENGTSDVWLMPKGGIYPVLSAFSGFTPAQLRGQGTPEEPYLISDAQELGAMAHYRPYAHYRLAASVDLSGIRWAAAVIPWFAGTFDGNGHTISNLTISGGGYLGPFGQLASGAEVRNLGLVAVNIVGSGDYVGGLVADNGGTATQCYSTGAVSGSSRKLSSRMRQFLFRIKL